MNTIKKKDLWAIISLKSENIDFSRSYCDSKNTICVCMGERKKYEKLDHCGDLERIIQEAYKPKSSALPKIDYDEVYVIIDLTDENHVELRYAVLHDGILYEELSSELIRLKLVKILHCDKSLYNELKNTYDRFVSDVMEWVKSSVVRPVILDKYKKDREEFVNDEICRTAYTQIRKPVGEKLDMENIIITAVDPWCREI